MRGSAGPGLVVALVALLVGMPASFPPAHPGTGPGAVGPGPAPMLAPSPANCSSSPKLTINATPMNGTAPLLVHFQGNITGGCGPFQTEWEFGDAAEGTGLSPSHTYRGAGNFTVYAETTGTGGGSSEARLKVHVQGGAGKLVVNVSVTPNAGTAPLVVTAWANVTGGNTSQADSIQWTFGDGGTGIGSPIQHTFGSAGTFPVNARAQVGNRSASNTTDVTVTNGSGPPPATNLSLVVVPASAHAPANVTLYAFTNGAHPPYDLSVCFGDDTPCASGPPNWTGSSPAAFVHPYPVAGAYSVEGTLSSLSGLVEAAASVFVNITPGPALLVTANLTPPSGTAPFEVTFQAQVSGGTPPYSVQWWFGDGSVGSSSPGAPVRHPYTAAGTYHPFLAVRDAGGNSQNVSLGSVQVAGASTLQGLGGSYDGVSVPTVFVALAAIAGGIGIAVGHRSFRSTRDRQLQKEGEELVRELEDREGP